MLKTLIGAACVVIIAAGAAKAYGAYSQARDVAERDATLRYELTIYAQGASLDEYCAKTNKVLTIVKPDNEFLPTWRRHADICRHLGYL